MSKTGQHNPDLKKYVSVKEAEAHEKGASGGFRAKKEFNERERIGGHSSDRTKFEWHVKTPSELTHNPMLCSADFPDGSAPLTEAQLQDQHTIVRKSLLADSLWSAFHGKENVAKTRHWHGSFAEGEQAQHYMASRIDPEVQGTITDLSDSDHRTKASEREPVTEYKGQAIKEGKVNGKPIVGFGSAAATSLFLGSPDQHSGNFGLKETDSEISVFKFDNKFDMGAFERFPRKFFSAQAVGIIQNEIDAAEAAIDYYAHTYVDEQKDYSLSALTEIQQKIDEGKIENKADLQEFIEIFYDEDSVVATISPEKLLDANEFKIADSAKDLINDYVLNVTTPEAEDLVNYYTHEKQVAEAKLQNPGGLNHVIPEFDTSQPLEDFFKDVFSPQDNRGPSFERGNEVFNFGFPDDFYKAPHVQQEFLETAYMIMNMEPEKLKTLAETIMGKDVVCPVTGKPISQEISNQLAMNQQKLEQTIGQHPEYQKFVLDNKAELETKLDVAEKVIEAKAKEFDIAYERPADKGKYVHETEVDHTLTKHESQKQGITEQEVAVVDVGDKKNFFQNLIDQQRREVEKASQEKGGGGRKL